PLFLFSLNPPPNHSLYTLSLHDALPIYKSQEKDGGDTDTQETGEKTLYINNDQEPTSFDPSMGFDSVSWDPLNQIMEGLMRLDEDRKSTRLNSSHVSISYAVFCLKKKKI